MKQSLSWLSRYAGRTYALGLAAWFPFFGKLELAREGQTPYVVVQAKDATPAEQFAAQELTNFLFKITGATFPLVSETNRPAPAQGIYVGWTEFAAQHEATSAARGQEEWLIKSVGKDLVFTGGRPRGTLYGVYEFLDKYGGCRWVSDDQEVVPSNPHFKIPAINISGQPASRLRETTIRMSRTVTGEVFALYLTRNRYNQSSTYKDPQNVPRFGFVERFGAPGFCHTFSLYDKEWKNVKPEYYALLEDGKRAERPKEGESCPAQFCLTHPEVRDRVFETLVNFIKADREAAARKGQPSPTLYSITQNDNDLYCRCQACMAIAQREGSYSGTTIDFLNDLADRLKPLYPDIRLVTFAYHYTKEPPKTIRPRDNVIDEVALLDREFTGEVKEVADVTRPIEFPSNAEAKRITDGWGRVVSPGNLLIWDYAMFYRQPYQFPYDVTAKIAANLEYYHRIGCQFIFMENEAIEVSFRGLRDWLFMQKSVNPHRDTDALIDDFMKGYFGPGAAPMRQYRDLLAKATLQSPKPLGITPLPSNPYLNADFFHNVNALLDDAEARCAGAGHEKYLRNVRAERIPVDLAALKLWHKFAGKPGFAPADRASVLKRYEANMLALIVLYKSPWHNAESLKAQMTAFEIGEPAEFKDRNPNILYAFHIRGPGRPLPMPDADATGGYAMRLGKEKAEHKLPFSAMINDGKAFLPYMTLDKVPADSRYHWYKINTVALNPNCSFIATGVHYIWIPLKWAALPPPNNELEVWVSLKFTGPAYVPGSTDPDEVRLDRMLVVPPLTAKE